MDINFETVKEFLDYEDKFWDYIRDKVTYVDSKDKGAIYFYGVYLNFDKNKNISGMRICVPKIINIFTASVNVHEFKHAYDAFCLLGDRLLYDNEYYEKCAKEKELEFIKKYRAN